MAGVPYPPENVNNFRDIAHPLPKGYATGVPALPLLPTFSPVAFNKMVDLMDTHKDGGARQAFLAKVYALGTVICDHGMQNDVGVWLVHKHFDVGADERVLAEVKDRKIEVQVVKGAPADSDVPVFFQVQPDGWAPMQYVQVPSHSDHVLQRVRKVTAASEFLKAFGACVRALGMEEELGLCIQHNDLLTLNPSEGLMETTVEGEKTQTLTVMGVNDLAARSDASTTSWKFVLEDSMRMGYCQQMCSCSWQNNHPHPGSKHYYE